ncbi:unnamed protein product [Urochloa humidicola]
MTGSVESLIIETWVISLTGSGFTAPVSTLPVGSAHLTVGTVRSWVEAGSCLLSHRPNSRIVQAPPSRKQPQRRRPATPLAAPPCACSRRLPPAASTFPHPARRPRLPPPTISAARTSISDRPSASLAVGERRISPRVEPIGFLAHNRRGPRPPRRSSSSCGHLLATAAADSSATPRGNGRRQHHW